ncbi:ABC transporter permease [Sporosarcina limicola]|uniref:Multidrug/hemolysin transport system permease protein n=1 Tax=Sporosarcina limicola TaxID=34101 RepID=A0A927MKP0_9BACL|nr:ABC transporter permease [Sporosarcina limicola]MBE1554712.1 multidrug/hemolysin transport system permease protein [Sporosarcina limicola]
MLAIAKRNILLYFRDKTTVFYSLLAVIILIALYVLFLGDTTSKGLPDFPAKKQLLTSWFIAGILAVTSVTTTLGAFGILVDDRTNKIDMDFDSSPLQRFKLVGGYITSALFVGVVMCLFTFIVVDLYLLFSGENVLPFAATMQLIGIVILSVLASGSMVLLPVSFFHTSSSFAAASMVIGTFIGFLAGIYIPIGGLPDYLQSVVKWFPVSHTAALFRQILMESPLIDSFANAPSGTKKDFLLNMGIFYEINGSPTSKLFSVFYLIGTAILFFILSLLVMMKKRK